MNAPAHICGMSMLRTVALATALLLVPALPAAAQDAVPEPDAEAAAPPNGPADAAPSPSPSAELPPPIYEDQLLRLSEILGALSFLRGLCGDDDAAVWRDEMVALIAAEQPTPQRRGRIIGRFNHGFETFNAVYRSCTPSARRSISRYLAEGQALSADVRSRYSQ